MQEGAPTRVLVYIYWSSYCPLISVPSITGIQRANCQDRLNCAKSTDVYSLSQWVKLPFANRPSDTTSLPLPPPPRQQITVNRRAKRQRINSSGHSRSQQMISLSNSNSLNGFSAGLDVDYLDGICNRDAELYVTYFDVGYRAERECTAHAVLFIHLLPITHCVTHSLPPPPPTLYFIAVPIQCVSSHLPPHAWLSVSHPHTE